MSKKNILIPVAILSAAILAVPGVASARPTINVDSDPSCAGLSFTAASPGDGFASGTYTVTAQEFDSATVTPSGPELVFTGSVTWGETISVPIPAAGDYLLWTYRVDSAADGQGTSTIGEHQLDCRAVEVPEPEAPEVPDVEEPEAPEVPDVEEPEAPEVETPEVPEEPTVEDPAPESQEPTTPAVVTEKTTIEETTSGEPVEEAAVPVLAEPVTVG